MMISTQLDDTIVAISTPIGEGGIGIVRISGKDALNIADRIFLSKDNERPSTFRTYTLHYGYVVDRVQGSGDRGQGIKSVSGFRLSVIGNRRKPKTSNRKPSIVDEVLLTVMRAPKSYTKEDIVEINCHSGIVPLRKILELVLVNGARLAEPGEFTKRAFLNGRIDILQAESVIDIVRAKTELSLNAAVNNLKGIVSKRINTIREELVSILAHMSMSIDWTEEEDLCMVKKTNIVKRLKSVSKDIENLISTSREGRILRQGIRTVICGSPNVGKSSLMNALLKESRSIVTHLPGTTRDTIEEVVNIKGVPVVLIDTAGITETDHPVEKEGIKRTHLSMQNADLVLLVLDYGRRIMENDLDLMDSIRDKEDIIVVINKKDLKKRIDINIVKSRLNKRDIVYVSSLTSSGIDKLENMMQDIVFRGKVPTSDIVSVSNDREIAKLRHSLEDIKIAINSFRNKISMDCIAVYVHSSIERISEITGHSISEEALDKIFSEFCIGK